MQFEQFTELVDPILNQPPERQVPELAKLFGVSPLSELASIIYLLQGRFGPPTVRLRRIKGWPTHEKIFKNLASVSNTGDASENPTVTDVYNKLRECIIFDAISRYSPDYLVRMKSVGASLSSKSLSMIALAFSTGALDDRTLIKAIAKMGGGGLGSKRAIASLYQKTLPDLGVIATKIRQSGYFDTVTLPPQFGTIVPREEIRVWESIEQAWETLSPSQGLFIQGKFFDGIHVQIHKSGKKVRIFNIHGNEITSAYAHLSEIIRGAVKEDEIIVDCELIAFNPRTRRILPLHRIPDTRNHILAVFDILKLDAEDWRGKRYEERKEKLEELFGPLEFRKSGIYLPREALAKSLNDSKEIIAGFLDKPHFEGVIIKSPSGIAKTGSVSKDRGRLKPYTIIDSILVGYNSTRKSFLVGVWSDEKKRSILPYRNVEGVRREIVVPLQELIKNKLTRQRPAWVEPKPVPDWYLTEPIVVAIKWDGLIVPNRGKDFIVKWLPHEGVTIVGIYPAKAKSANTLARLYSLRKRDIE